MKKLKTMFRALTGYAGSSEHPTKTSMRFMGIITALASQFAPLIAVIASQFVGGGVIIDVDRLSNIIEPLTLAVACVIWIVGAIRAVLNTPTVSGYLKK